MNYSANQIYSFPKFAAQARFSEKIGSHLGTERRPLFSYPVNNQNQNPHRTELSSLIQ